MAVYVDPLIPWPKVPGWSYGAVSHLHTDVGNLAELHSFAQSIGLKRQWFQDNIRMPHYDLTPNKRMAAVRQGAIEVTGKQMVARMKQWIAHKRKEYKS